MPDERFDAAMAARSILGETGDVQLASLTREELRGLGDDALVANAADTLWWDGLAEREQELVLETAQRGLLARNLLAPDGQGELVATDEVKVVLAARTAPDWILVLAEPAAEHDSDGAPLQLALLALPTPSGRPPAVLVTARLEGIYLHRLVTTDSAYRVAADWLLRAAPEVEAEIGRTVEVLAPRENGSADSGRGLHTTRALVVGRGQARLLAEVVGGEPGEPALIDLDTLADWVRQQVC